jgi:hypothetical protein
MIMDFFSVLLLISNLVQTCADVYFEDVNWTILAQE